MTIDFGTMTPREYIELLKEGVSRDRGRLISFRDNPAFTKHPLFGPLTECIHSLSDAWCKLTLSEKTMANVDDYMVPFDEIIDSNGFMSREVFKAWLDGMKSGEVVEDEFHIVKCDELELGLISHDDYYYYSKRPDFVEYDFDSQSPDFETMYQELWLNKNERGGAFMMWVNDDQ